MRYLVHKGTGTILAIDSDLVVVDVYDDDIDESDIVELANSAPTWDKAIVVKSNECLIDMSDEAIRADLYAQAYDYQDQVDDDDVYVYCLNNPETYDRIRRFVANDDALWNEYIETWQLAVSECANYHRKENEVAQ